MMWVKTKADKEGWKTLTQKGRDYNLKIKTLKPQTAISWHELPADQQKEFNYITEDAKHDDRFVKNYHDNNWVDYYDMVRVTKVIPILPKNHPFRKWDGYEFSGILCKIIYDYGEKKIILGLYM